MSVGSFFPSTRFVCRSITRRFPAHVKTVCEYGPGTGVITREILNRLGADGKLYAVELNKEFVDDLKTTITDSRFKVMNADVVQISASFKSLDPRGIDAAVSGIPFSLMPPAVVEATIKNTAQNLNPGGVFVVYQHTRQAVPLLRKYFSRVEVGYEPRNIFPYFIMTAYK